VNQPELHAPTKQRDIFQYYVQPNIIKLIQLILKVETRKQARRLLDLSRTKEMGAAKAVASLRRINNPIDGHQNSLAKKKRIQGYAKKKVINPKSMRSNARTLQISFSSDWCRGRLLLPPTDPRKSFPFTDYSVKNSR
jgi:hypothetical protein